MPQRLYVGLDVGGTSMKAGVVDDSGRVSGEASLPTEPERGQDIGLETMAACIHQAIDAAGTTLGAITAIGVATPGSMDIPAGLILEPPNLKPWRNVPVRDYIARTFGKPTAFQNDANAAAFGEFWVGAAKDVRSLVLFTLGTGIGGGIIIDGRILEGAQSHGGELGHTKIQAIDGRLCGCGRRGCLEAYGSATAVVQRTHEALAGRASALSGEFTSRDVFEAAAAGDELSREIVDRTAYYLGVGAANAMHTTNPEMICFGGGMAGAGRPLLDAIRRYACELAFALPAKNTRIELAVLGGDAGFIGAAGCARELVAT